MEGEGREALRQEAEGTDEPCRRANPSRLPPPLHPSSERRNKKTPS